MSIPSIFVAIFDLASSILFLLVIYATPASSEFLFFMAAILSGLPYVSNFGTSMVVSTMCAFRTRDRSEQGSWFAVVLCTMLSGDLIQSLALVHAIYGVYIRKRPIDRVEAFQRAFGTRAIVASVIMFIFNLVVRDIGHIVIQIIFLTTYNGTSVIVILALAASIVSAAIGIISFLFFTLIPIMQAGDVKGVDEAPMELVPIPHQNEAPAYFF